MAQPPLLAIRPSKVFDITLKVLRLISMIFTSIMYMLIIVSPLLIAYNYLDKIFSSATS